MGGRLVIMIYLGAIDCRNLPYETTQAMLTYRSFTSRVLSNDALLELTEDQEIRNAEVELHRKMRLDVNRLQHDSYFLSPGVSSRRQPLPHLGLSQDRRMGNRAKHRGAMDPTASHSFRVSQVSNLPQFDVAEMLANLLFSRGTLEGKKDEDEGSTTLAPYTHFMPAPAYKISKAALNALTVQYALDLAKDGFTFIALAPGVRISLPLSNIVSHC